MLKKFVNYIAFLIEKKKAIRRFIVFTTLPTWLILSILFGIKFMLGWKVSTAFVGYYSAFTGIIGAIVGFYFYTRSKEENNMFKGE